MRDPMTQRFVTAFLTTCFENGLSKEAAAQLLQRESLVQELDARPAFAVGYLAKVASFPGQMRAMLSPRDLSELQKSAARRPPKIGAFKQMWEGIKGFLGRRPPPPRRRSGGDRTRRRLRGREAEKHDIAHEQVSAYLNSDRARPRGRRI